MADDIIGGFFKGVDKFLGGTGGEPSTTPVQSVDEYGGIIEQSPVIPDAHVEPVIPENQTVVVGGRDESGEYKPVSTDTSAPTKQSFADAYISYEKSPELTRMDYTKLADIGDKGTQDLLKSGYSAEQATALQRDKVISDLVSKGYTKEQAAESKDARYYQNEYDKAMQSKEAISDIYHHKALESGLAQAPNPFEHTGDLAKMALEKSQGVSNIPGTGLIPQFKGSLLEDANIVTKAARTGEMGDYKYLGKPFSSEIGILDLSTQQAIGRTAAASALKSGKEGPQSGWIVNEGAMKEFTPEMAKASGFNLFYREAKLQDVVGGGGGGGAGIEKNVSKMTEGISKGTLAKEENIMLPFGLGDTGISKGTGEKGDNIMLPFGLGDTGISRGTKGKDTSDKSTKGSYSEYETDTGVVSAKNIAQVSDMVVKTNPINKEVSEYKSPADIFMGTSGETIGGYSMATNPLLNKVPGHYGTKESDLEYIQRTRSSPWAVTLPWATPRRAKKSVARVDIKPKKVSSFYRVTNEQVIPQTIGKDFFKFKVGSTKVVTSATSPIVNLNKINIGISNGLKTSKGSTSAIKMPKLRSVDNSTLNKGSKMSVNVNSIMKKMTVKKLKVK